LRPISRAETESSAESAGTISSTPPSSATAGPRKKIASSWRFSPALPTTPHLPWARIRLLLSFPAGVPCSSSNPRRPQSHRELGSAWVEISKRLPGRTDNAIKNRWNSSMRKRYAATGAASPCKRPAPLLNAAPASVLPPSKRIKTEGTLGSSAAPRVPPVGVQGRAAGGGQAVSARPLSSSDQRAKLGSGTTMTLSVVAPRSAPNSHRRRNLQVMFFF